MKINLSITISVIAVILTFSSVIKNYDNIFMAGPLFLLTLLCAGFIVAEFKEINRK